MTYEDIEAQLLDSLIARFNDLETIVKTAHSVSETREVDVTCMV
jgi:hypothetical protein